MLWNGEQAGVQGLLLAIHGREPGRNLHVYNSHPREPLQTHLESSFLFSFKFSLSSSTLLTKNSYH